MNKQYKPVPSCEELQYKGTPEKPDIKIFVSHRIDKESETIDNPLYIPVRCGAVFDEREDVAMLGDDTGDNISEKRLSFCEYTVMYWAWKNVEADYYGLCHYRRYLSFAEDDLSGSVLKQGLLDSMAEVNLKRCELLDVSNMQRKISNCDLIVPYEYHMVYDTLQDSNCENIREQWEKHYRSFLKPEHFKLLLNLINKYNPEIYSNAKEYMHGRHFYGFNCFIMKKDLFFQMCEFIFPILFELEKQISLDHFSSTQKRAVGYAGEWLFSIWIYNMKKKEKIQIEEQQLVAFQNTDKEYSLKPAFKNNNIPIVIPLNDGNRAWVSVCLESIIEHSAMGINYDIIFLQRSYDDDRWGSFLKKEENAGLLKMICDKDNFSVRFYDPKDKIGIFELHDYSEISNEENYYAILLPWILENYEKVIFVRGNTLFQADIAELLDYDLQNKNIAGIKDPIFAAMLNGFVPEFKEKCDKTLNLKDPYRYVSTDIIVMNTRNVRLLYSKDDIISQIKELKAENIADDGFNRVFEEDIMFLSQHWSKLGCTEPRYFELIEYIPEDLSEGKMEVKGISLRGYLGISMPEQTQVAQKFWGYARKTPFYEQLLLQRVTPHIYDIQQRIGVFDTRTGARKLADKVLPKGTRRREFAKYLLPKGSLRWRFCKQIYYIFKPQYRPKKETED